MASGKPPRPLSTYVRYGIWLAAAILAALHFLHDGLDLLSVGSIAVMILLGFAFQYVEQTGRPVKNYLRAALGAIILALVLIVMPLLMGAAIWIGLILWAGLAGALLAWAIYYERTEPL